MSHDGKEIYYRIDKVLLRLRRYVEKGVDTQPARQTDCLYRATHSLEWNGNNCYYCSGNRKPAEVWQTNIPPVLAHKELGRGGGEIPEDIQIGYQSDVSLQEERSLLIDRGCEDGTEWDGIAAL